jgi:threonine synthase
MGLLVDRLVIGTNRNDILTRFLRTGRMTIGEVQPSLSPSMDIQVSSNFERLLWELKGRDGAAVAAALAEFRKTGTLPVADREWAAAKTLFSAYAASDEETIATIRQWHRSTGEVLDPHSAVAVRAAEAAAREGGTEPIVALACAHPAKFPEAIEQATRLRPALPPVLADLMERPERTSVLPNDLRAVQRFVREHARVAA